MNDESLRDHGATPDEPSTLCEANIRAVRLGHGANCSSVGSVIDTLFVSAAVGGAIFAAICAAMRDEPVRVVGSDEGDEGDAERSSGERRDESEPAS